MIQRTNWPIGSGNPKYKTAEHRRERAKWVAVMRSQGYLTCAQPECLMADRVINDGDAWHLGHDDTGTAYIGPTHARCNVVDAAKRARAKQLRPSPNRWKL